MNQEQHFPSWIADWSRPTTYDRSASTTMVAAGISSARASFIPPDILEVDGVHCATVSAVYEPILKNPVQSSDVIRQWGPAHLQNGLYPTGESYSDAFATTIIRNLLRERFPTYSSYATLQEWEKKVFSGGEAKSSRILQYTQNSAFVVTEEGYIGLSTLDTKPGINNRDISLQHRKLTQYFRRYCLHHFGMQFNNCSPTSAYEYVQIPRHRQLLPPWLL